MLPMSASVKTSHQNRREGWVASGREVNEQECCADYSSPLSSEEQDGYSGDCSSISDLSESEDNQSKNGLSDGRGGKKVSDLILKNNGDKNAPKRARRRRSSKRSNKRVGVHYATLPDEDLPIEHIHHRNHHRNHHGHHLHQQARELNASSLDKDQDADSDEDVNRKIDELLNLYKVSLRAQRDIKNDLICATTSDQPMKVENSQPQNALFTTTQQMSLHSGHNEDMDELYANIVHACRPFFNDSHAMMTGKQPLKIQTNTAGSDEALSSEGFTSFFTTTNQSGTNTNESGESSNDFGNQINGRSRQEDAAEDFAHEANDSSHEANDSSSETSSMVVQARLKRKYKEQSRACTSNSDANHNLQTNIGGGAGETMIRIVTVVHDPNISMEKTESIQQQQRTESSSLSLSAGIETNSVNESQEDSTVVKRSAVKVSSRTDETSHKRKKLPGGPISTPDSETGAGESKEEGKQKPSNAFAQMVEIGKPFFHHHLHHHIRNEMKPQEASINNAEDSARHDSKGKRQEKKRKRMVSRREYEEELRQMHDSSESNSDAALEPGQPVTLEEVLALTNTARLLVQAIPPFLAVHINAAFTNLCGIQSSTIIGRPVSTIISLPSSKEGESSESDDANSREESSKVSPFSESVDGSGSRMVANGSRQADTAAPMGEGDFQNLHSHPSGLRIDRLIATRGYGHIHNVELECNSVSNTQNSHAIEGFGEEFIEGNIPSKRSRKSKPKLSCRMRISPVVSSSARTANGSSKSQPPQGRDSNSGSGNMRRDCKHPTELPCVRHYLIQLEALNGPRSLVSFSSFASYATDTTLEAQCLGITKADVHARRSRLENDPKQNIENQQMMNAERGDDQGEAEESQDEDSAMELVATCG